MENMHSEIHMFANEDFGMVRVFLIGNEPWFIGEDAVRTLEYKNGDEDIVAYVDKDDRKTVDEEAQYGFGIESARYGSWIINKSGLYSLIRSSRVSYKKSFELWIESVVLPQLENTDRQKMMCLRLSKEVAYECLIKDREQERKVMQKAIEIKNTDRAVGHIHPDSYCIERAVNELRFYDESFTLPTDGVVISECVFGIEIPPKFYGSDNAATAEEMFERYEQPITMLDKNIVQE